MQLNRRYQVAAPRLRLEPSRYFVRAGHLQQSLEETESLPRRCLLGARAHAVRYEHAGFAIVERGDFECGKVEEAAPQDPEAHERIAGVSGSHEVLVGDTEPIDLGAAPCLDDLHVARDLGEDGKAHALEAVHWVP